MQAFVINKAIKSLYLCFLIMEMLFDFTEGLFCV